MSEGNTVQIRSNFFFRTKQHIAVEVIRVSAASRYYSLSQFVAALYPKVNRLF